MHSIKLRVPKKIFINSRLVKPDLTKVNWTLPRSRKGYNLYELETSESNNSEIYYHLTGRDVEGVYEMNLPAEFRSIITLGSLIRPKYRMIKLTDSALNRVYDLKELDSSDYEHDDIFPDIMVSS